MVRAVGSVLLFSLINKLTGVFTRSVCSVVVAIDRLPELRSSFSAASFATGVGLERDKGSLAVFNFIAATVCLTGAVSADRYDAAGLVEAAAEGVAGLAEK